MKTIRADLKLTQVQVLNSNIVSRPSRVARYLRDVGLTFLGFSGRSRGWAMHASNLWASVRPLRTCELSAVRAEVGAEMLTLADWQRMVMVGILFVSSLPCGLAGTITNVTGL